MKKMLFTSLFALLTLGAGAAAVDFNGGFEKCQADKKGIPQAAGWNKNRVVSKKAECRLTKEAGCVKSGTFALQAETEEKGHFFYRSLKSIPVCEGDTIEMEIFAKGSGKYNLQYIVYGADDPKNIAFLVTAGTGRYQEASEDEWKKYSAKVTFQAPAKAKGKFTKFVIIPVICADENAELYFDDFALKITKPAK